MPTAAMISSIEVDGEAFRQHGGFRHFENAGAGIDFRGLGVEHGALYQEYGFSFEPFPGAVGGGQIADPARANFQCAAMYHESASGAPRDRYVARQSRAVG